MTSSSRRMGTLRTPYLLRRSLLKGALMMILRRKVCAVKCALRFLERLLDTAPFLFIAAEV
eukprot:CAMPEP_0171056738 /NCGR_PEP_ID=MMETSP0766_2-20121228/1277_1 /TAXON_ID=439317 /ORGANISM="Gambierdiscus australes, Strain CAWD 149" /LENGTH=60 /DNA_ID=CAMNT_0011511725 /DNA_START=337 /DNA_END=519 /DNA_ORIENTATION=+